MKKQIQFFFILLGCLAFNYATAQVNYQWVKSIHSGTPNADLGKSIVTDNLGNVYVTGRLNYSVSEEAEFNPYGTSSNLLSSAGNDCFFAKYGADGNCVWAKSMKLLRLDGLGAAGGTSIAVDGEYNVYVLGFFNDSVDFDPDPVASYKLYSAGGSDCFFAKYNSNGDFIWAKQFGGSGVDIGTRVVVDGLGTGVYLTGYFNSPSANFTSLSGIDISIANITGGNDIFISSYDTAGVFLWSKGISGSGEDMGLAIDASDTYVTITGSFQGGVDFNPGATPKILTALGLKDAFVAKYFLDGSFGWAKNLGNNSSGTNTAVGTGIAIDANKIYVTGVYKGNIDFDLGISKPSVGFQDVFFAQYNISDESLGFGYNIGSNADTVSVYDISIDLLGNFYLTGNFRGLADFNPGAGVYDTLRSAGLGDIFIAKYNNLGAEVFAKRIGGTEADNGYGIAVDNSGNIYLTGSYGDTVDFDPGQGIAKRICLDAFISKADIFIAKYSEGTSTIKGHVTRSSNGDAVAIGNNNCVNLYTQTVGDGNAAMHLVDTAIINSNGDYEFTDLCAGDYIALAIALGNDYQTVAPTYYGGFTHWNQSTHIITVANVIDTADIVMLEYVALPGDAKIGGRIVGENGFDRTVKPLSGIPVGLEGDPGSIIIDHTVTNDDGYYSFTNISADTCYKIYVNIPGLPIVSNYHACPQSSDSIMTLDFVADSTSIDTVLSVPNSVLQMSSSKTKILLYPNPNKGFTTIEFTMVELNWVHIEIYNLLGEKVTELLNEQKPTGNVKVGFNAIDKGMKAGIYLLNLKIGDEIITKKIIQIE